MATEHGFSSGHDHLLFTRLKTFALANGWTALEDDGAKLWLEGEGGGSDHIIVGAQLFEDVPNDNFAWVLQGAIGWTSGLSFHNQQGVIPGPNYLALGLVKPTPSNPNAMEYWFSGDSFYLSGLVKAAGTYQWFYLGWMLPYATPDEWPYPLAIGGSTHCDTTTGKPYRYSNTDERTAAFWRPRQLNGNAGQLAIRTPSGWVRPVERQAGAQQSGCEGVWPYMEAVKGEQDEGFLHVTQNLDDSYPAIDLEPVQNTASKEGNIFGTLRGMRWVSGFGQSPENIVTIDGDDHITAPNVFRTGTDQWAAMRVA